MKISSFFRIFFVFSFFSYGLCQCHNWTQNRLTEPQRAHWEAILWESTRNAIMATITDKTITSHGMTYTVTAVDGMDRVEINNKLHYLGDQILKLKMQQAELIKARKLIDQHNKDLSLGDLFLEMFSL